MEGYSYSQPVRMNYSFGAIAFTTALTHQLLPPLNTARARVVDIHVRATVTFTATGTPAYVNLGTAALATRYAQLALGTTAAATSINIGSAAGSPFNLTGIINQEIIDLANDATAFVQLQVVAPTGGSPAGTGYLDVALVWF